MPVWKDDWIPTINTTHSYLHGTRQEAAVLRLGLPIRILQTHALISTPNLFGIFDRVRHFSTIFLTISPHFQKFLVRIGPRLIGINGCLCGSIQALVVDVVVLLIVVVNGFVVVIPGFLIIIV